MKCKRDQRLKMETRGAEELPAKCLILEQNCGMEAEWVYGCCGDRRVTRPGFIAAPPSGG